MQHHIISRSTALLLTGPILLFALYVQFHGDFGPGGGFQAGVIYAVALILYGLMYGTGALLKAVPVRWCNVGMALGLMLYIGTGLACMALGGRFLDYSVLLLWADASTQAGQHLGILLVEFGVGMTVASALLNIFIHFSRP
ncbi:MAG: Na(+)/H(+) antiporter subunit B [Proteobacteria bacterium]|nr:Na(+)/H(+) antiporter subunit B [Pseudomonadota bacterium]